MGDAANQFTLELFDETAWKIESALYGTKSAPISIVYGASDDWEHGNHIMFTGNITNYSISFVGAATMLSIEGIVYGVQGIEGSASTGFWFNKATVCWVDTNIQEPTNKTIFDYGPNDPRYRAACMIDGKSLVGKNGTSGGLDQGFEDVIEGEYADYICARIEWISPDKNGTKTEDNPEGTWTCRPLVNPANIFKRIIRKYAGDKNYNNENGVASAFQIGDVDETLWVDASSLDLTQVDEPASAFIVNTLCKIAVKKGSKTAGFKYFVKDGKHCFKAIDYDSNSANNFVVKTGYYVQDSEVISFSLDTVGAMVMAGSDIDDKGNPLVSIAAMDTLTSDIITTDFAFAEGNYKSEDAMEASEKTGSTNWYFASLTPVKVISSSSKDLLDVEYGNAFEQIKQFTTSASITIWGEYNNDYVPGNYLDLVVMTPDGKQHYSTGKYLIVSSEDSITSDGYTTTLRLLKNTGKVNNSSKTEVVIDAARAHFSEWYGDGTTNISNGVNAPGTSVGTGTPSGRGVFELTAYCPCKICCGQYSKEAGGAGTTKTGTIPVEGRTIAVDPSVIPLGSIVTIFGLGDRVAEDIGGAIKSHKIDVFFNSHQDAWNFGHKYGVQVQWRPPNG